MRCFVPAMRFGLPLIALRGISDGDADLGHITGWTQYLGIIDVKLADAVDHLEAALAERYAGVTLPAT